MAFTVSDFHDLVELLEQQPQWRRELRRLVLTDELLELPRVVRELGDRTAELAEAQRRTEAVVAELVISQRQMSEDLGTLKGFAIEQSFCTRPPAWYGRILRRPHVLTDEELIDLSEPALERGALTEERFRDLSCADAVVSGRLRNDGQPVYLIVEVSWEAGELDLKRAMRRAAHLAQAGVRAHPALGGRWITPQVKREAESVKDIHLIEWKGELAELFG